MASGTSSARVRPGAPAPFPELSFRIVDAAAERHVAVPTISFQVAVRNRNGQPVRSALLDTQVQIAATRRSYQEDEHDSLADLFGTPQRWGTTLRTLPWTRITRVVPGFEGETEIGLAIPCSYDLEVVAARYFAGLRRGEVPLEFLFSGTVFYATEDGALQTARISWEEEAEYSLPLDVWRQAIDRHFPDAAWMRVSRETFDRLNAERARRGDANFEATLNGLLETGS
jgi:hypothetical protein